MKSWIIRAFPHTAKAMFREGPSEVLRPSFASGDVEGSGRCLEFSLSELSAHVAQVRRRLALSTLDATPPVGAIEQLRKVEAELDELLRIVRKTMLHAEPIGDLPETEVAPEAMRTLRHSVLFVDDDPAARKALEDLLKPHFEVIVAASALEALQRVQQAQPDVIVADFCMPEFDGLSLLKALRHSFQPNDEVPCLILSGFSDTEAKILALEAGAFDYLTKPVNATELIARIRSVLARAAALRRERALGSTDELTGLFNRRGFRSFFENALRSARVSGTDLTLVVADINELKKINDRYGHLIGDQAIRVAGRALAIAKRSADCAARIGGDEFVVVMPGTNQAGGVKLIQRVDAELRARPIATDAAGVVQVSATYGIAMRNEGEGEEALEQIFDRADRDLYRIKRTLQS